MTERVALVTGGARGIGAATVDALVSAGYGVVIVDRCSDLDGLSYSLATDADLDAVLARHGDAVRAVKGDVRDLPTMTEAVALAESVFGGLDVVVAGAGVATGGRRAWETSTEEVDLNLSVNLNGIHVTAQAAVPALLRRGAPRSGRFIAIASAAGVMANDLLAAYGASKHAAAGYIRGLAADLGTSGITANAVLPGSTGTALLEACAAFYDLDSVEEFAVHHLNERLLEPAEVAAAICFLASPESSAITGALIPVDGGMTAG